jgi:hypothetical protein
MSDKPKLNDGEFTLISVFIALGFLGALAFGGSFFAALFAGLIGLLFGAHLVSVARKARR